METRQNSMLRVVSRKTLEAICGDVSGMAHRFWVERVTRSRVHVGYSNPDEWGNEFPMIAVFPCYPSCWPGDGDNPRVVLDFLNVLHDSWNDEGWRAFQPIFDSEVC